MAGRFSLDAVFRAVDRMSAPIAKIQSRFESFAKSAEKGIKSLDTAADKWLGTLAKAGQGLAVVGGALGLAAYNVGKAGADFEQAITNVGAVSLMTRGQVADLEREARKLGLSTKYSATQVATGMETMGKAGFTNAQIVASVGHVLDAAAAEGADFDEVAGNISNTLKGMGLYVDDTAKLAENTQMVGDTLALASARTNSSMSSLAESMKNLAPIARQFNIPFKEAVASVALLQDVGIDASEAGTSMATALTKLATAPDAVKVKMKQLGVTFQDLDGNMLPLPKIFANFSKAAAKSGGNMKTAAFFAELLGLRGQRAGLNMQKLFESGKFKELTDELEKATGKAHEMAELRMDTFTGDLTKLGNTVDDIKISLFDMQSGPLRDVVQGMTQWLQANKGLITSGVEKFFKFFADNMESIVTWGTRIAKIITVITAASLAVKGLAAAVSILTWAISANPIALIAVAIVAAIALIWAFWPEISGFFAMVWGGIVDLSTSIWEAFAGMAAKVGEVFMSIFGPVFAFYKAYWTGLIEFFVGVFTIVFGLARKVLEPIFDFIRPKLEAVLGWLIGYWTFVWDLVSGVVKTGLDNVVSMVSTSFDIIAAIAKTYFDYVSTVWGGLVTVFSAIWEGIKWAFENTLGPVFDKIAWAVEKIRSIGGDTLGWDEEGASGAASLSSGAPQVVSPGERIAQSISESTTTQKSEVTIKDKTGRAVVTKKPAGPLMSMPILNQSGGF
jgi:TP901 family phage tail tape measure protein